MSSPADSGGAAATPVPPLPLPRHSLPALSPPGPPRADMSRSAEVQAWLRRLQAEDSRLGARNKYLAAALAAAVVALLVIVALVHRATIGAYATIDGIEVTQHPISQGRLQIKYRATSPGSVYCRRTSAGADVDVVDRFFAPCEVDRPWAWSYKPGDDIQASLWFRSGLFLRRYDVRFPTLASADIVMLIDTTGSMEPSIDTLKEKCVEYSRRLTQQSVRHRLALVAFGDANEGEWLDRHGFTADVAEFRRWVADIKRFDGGDFPESALDAMDEALTLPFDENACRYFYLVSDADFHIPTHKGVTVARVAEKLAEKRVMLRVFSRPKFEPAYAPLLGDCGRFDEIENFGVALSQGRILED